WKLLGVKEAPVAAVIDLPRASLSNATVKHMIDKGVAPSKLDQPWISAEENKGCVVVWASIARSVAGCSAGMNPLSSALRLPLALAPTPVRMH
ncbi:MAG: hypothetical protein ACKPKO_52015, partial [Candidatus Fonsibacter sp.]